MHDIYFDLDDIDKKPSKQQEISGVELMKSAHGGLSGKIGGLSVATLLFIWSEYFNLCDVNFNSKKIVGF